MPSEYEVPSKLIEAQVLDTIPTEIYLQIFAQLDAITDWIERLTTLQSLAQVCHLFRAAALPRIYGHIDISGDRADVDRQSKLGLALCHSVREDASSLAQFPKTARISFFLFLQGEVDSKRKDLLRTTLNALSMMPNLRCLDIFRTDLDSGCLTCIANLPVTRLTLDYICLSADITMELARQLPTLTLTHFGLSIHVPKFASGSPQVFERLLDVRSLEALEISCNGPAAATVEPIIERLLKLDDPARLKKLVFGDLIQSFHCVQLLQRFTNLKYFSIHGLSLSAGDHADMGPKGMIQLEHLYFPLDSLRLLPPQDQLTSLGIFHHPSIGHHACDADLPLKLFRNSWGHLCDLAICYSIYAVLSDKELCTGLVTLFLTFDGPELEPIYEDLDLEDLIRKLKPSKSVKFINCWGDLERHGPFGDSLRSAITTAFPIVESITVLGLRWGKGPDGRWGESQRGMFDIE